MTSAAATASRAGSRWLSRNARQSIPAVLRIDLLIDQPVRELFDPAIQLPLEERRRHVERHPGRELLHQLRPDVALRGVPGFVLEILPHPRAQRLERLERPQVLGELVVELGELPALERLERDRVLDIGAGQLGNRVVRRIADRERLGRADFEPEQLFVEAGRVGGRANLDVDILVAVASCPPDRGDRGPA